MPVPAGHAPAARTLLRDNVYTAIRDAIVRGQLLPGERLRDGELGEWLGVSRTPVREALLRLAEAGLVQAQPGKVTLVAPEDPVALAHARTIAAELHALAARLAATAFGGGGTAQTLTGGTPGAGEAASSLDRGNGSPAETDPAIEAGPSVEAGPSTGASRSSESYRSSEAGLSRLREANARLRASAAEPEAAIRADAEFHDAVAGLSGNPLIRTQLELLSPMLMRAEYLHFDAATVEASAAQHEAIIAALEQGDAERAAGLTRRNWLTLG
jgi:DNA-binding GntR family transcriptional regulator